VTCLPIINTGGLYGPVEMADLGFARQPELEDD